jgi:hypothetical protein
MYNTNTIYITYILANNMPYIRCRNMIKYVFLRLRASTNSSVYRRVSRQYSLSFINIKKQIKGIGT